MQEERHSGRHAVIIGAGIVGACIAQRMTSQGWRVTVIEPGAPGGPQAASYGNGAFISPASIIPMSVPGLWRKVPGYLLDTTGPLTIRWASMPRLTPWLSRFLLAGATEARLRRTVSRLDLLLQDGPARHRALADSIGLPGMIVESGLLYAYPDRAAFAAEAPFWALRREAGLTWQELDTPALRAAEPALSDRYTFGLLLAGGSQCTDPGGYAAAILRASGAELRRSRAGRGHAAQPQPDHHL